MHQRFNDGVTNATQLLGELKARGCRGSYVILRDHLSPPGQPIMGWIMTDPQNMEPDDQ